VHVVAPDVVHVAPPGVAVTVYDVRALPPLFVGADQETDAEPLEAVATTFIGAAGTEMGVKPAEAFDGSDTRPAVSVAIAVKVYRSPFVRPVIVQVVALTAVQVSPPFARVVASVAVTV
jgi:hypothetical protein